MKNLFQKITKRAIDITISSASLVVLSPILLAVAYKIKNEDKGPVFFMQERSGLNNVPFRIYKFRSMKINNKIIGSNQNGIDYSSWNKGVPDDFIFKTSSESNPNVTKIGSTIRKYSIDELPQVINVLRGEMSIVGPRPEITQITNHYNEEQLKRLNVKPGITGWAQVNGRGEIPHKQKIDLDLWYIENQSILLDIKIIWLTFWQVLVGKDTI